MPSPRIKSPSIPLAVRAEHSRTTSPLSVRPRTDSPATPSSSRHAARDPTPSLHPTPSSELFNEALGRDRRKGTSLGAEIHDDNPAEEEEEEEGSQFAHVANGSARHSNMPSDLRPSLDEENPHHSQPLLSNDKHRHSYDDTHGGVSSRRGSHFLERDSPEEEAAKATRKRYTYAAGFLLVSLVAFAIQTETAVYIQHNLNWKKAYCMLYLTHGSWTVLYPLQLLILRIRKRKQPWQAFWRRHWTLLRQTGQMVEHRTLIIPPHLQKKSPIPYFLRTTAYVTCALTVAGGSWYVAVDLTTASDLTAIYNCSAFFAYVFAVPILHEKVRLSKIVAVGIAIVGVLVVAYGDSATAKHGSKSGGGTGGPQAPPDHEASNRALGNNVIGIGAVLYGFYEVLYKRVACPPDGCSPDRGVILANTFGSLIGGFTLLVLWIPIPILHVLGWETFELPSAAAARMLGISVLANATFSGCFLVLISLTSPVLSSVAALLTIFLVALCDQMLPPPLYSPLTLAAIMGGLLIIFAFLLLSWATYREMSEETTKHADEIVQDSESDEL